MRIKNDFISYYRDAKRIFQGLMPKHQPAILTIFQNIHTQVNILNLPFLPPHLLIKVKY